MWRAYLWRQHEREWDGVREGRDVGRPIGFWAQGSARQRRLCIISSRSAFGLPATQLHTGLLLKAPCSERGALNGVLAQQEATFQHMARGL